MVSPLHSMLLAKSVAAISAARKLLSLNLGKQPPGFFRGPQLHLRCPFLMAVRANLSNMPMKKRCARLILGEVLMGVQGIWAPSAWAAAIPAFSPSSWKP